MIQVNKIRGKEKIPHSRVAHYFMSLVASNEAQCRICRDIDNVNALLSPCACKGTVGHVHKACLVQWIAYRVQSRRGIEHCELCGSKLQVKWKTRAFYKWEKIHLTQEEKTKLNIFTFSYVVAAMGM